MCVYIYTYTHMLAFVKIKGIGISPLKDIDGSLCEWDLFDIVIEKDLFCFRYPQKHPYKSLFIFSQELSVLCYCYT